MRFTKMHGLGNDFVVLDGVRQTLSITPALAARLADRRFGIGCDQVLLVEAPRLPGTDFHYRIFNADGSEVEQCGNGARCFARFVHDAGLTDKTEIPVGTAAGPILLRVQPDEQITVDMGVPRLVPAQIPFLADADAPTYTLDLDGETVELAAVSMGNPHAVLRVDSVDSAPVTSLGPRIERHPRFPNRVNVGFLQVQDPGHVRLRVWERGAGETLACGTGACAAVVAGRRWGLLDARVAVSLPGGTLVIQWPGAGQPVQMTGPAARVFDGEIDL
ncbi:diaminopimelate epimerase [Thiohalocapsa sp. ML1]|jgi:diaminopimelate epimerase|uniref:diaminopimelate epimerase n=1 Tax=Thiohalocapsa sp. ML1 TaxID=1431688 RepID=UPI0007320289|nr:diaminopimelate epimerase [Thiohalocapsa sp. ML1]